MTKEQAKQNLHILQAFAEGKTIQYLYENNIWIDILDENAEFYFGLYKYRVKPEPRKFWLLLFKNYPPIVCGSEVKTCANITEEIIEVAEVVKVPPNSNQ